ncbi:nucleoside triphosphate pyrophosphohydrolase [Thiovibrio frasassiensis]|jgi:MazG family protein|uniref:Nucleoside triphosphate pyrophosphohydrolase n=1 Tax=Thiovibrio frasassiensis TaxID=2984131 RepID=A0A9X4RM68_9BACT|nr:nucleoside triphosphate pyrophosphohydrolase [Thiovibrio frasassiensis]MDG4476469.1 nucleoside triphosphate pyrophosphohydrolase [Thiovibrio frasassiensis]
MTPTAEKFIALIEIITRLRAPNGCPWDRKQTPQSFKQYLVEETHELLEAINDDDPSHICEELGDLLFQVIFLNNLYQEKNLFTLLDVIDSITTKMVRRHPHVFGNQTIESEQELRQQWQTIKNQENERKGHPRHPLDSIPKSLPALRRAQRVADRVAREGFDWPDLASALGKVDEEFAELHHAFAHGSRTDIREELGDLLFALTVLARKADIDGEDALHEATTKFSRRFLTLEKIMSKQGQQFVDLAPEALLLIWQQAKSEADTAPENN